MNLKNELSSRGVMSTLTISNLILVIILFFTVNALVESNQQTNELLTLSHTQQKTIRESLEFKCRLESKKCSQRLIHLDMDTTENMTLCMADSAPNCEQFTDYQNEQRHGH